MRKHIGRSTLLLAIVSSVSIAIVNFCRHSDDHPVARQQHANFGSVELNNATARTVKRVLPDDDTWLNHPALAEPDGSSHRGDAMIGAEIVDPRILHELSRRYRQAVPLSISEDGEVVGGADFESRQEYFLRLMDYYVFSQDRLVGMTRDQVEGIFGPLGGTKETGEIGGSRDHLLVRFEDDTVSNTFYVIGY